MYRFTTHLFFTGRWASRRGEVGLGVTGRVVCVGRLLQRHVGVCVVALVAVVGGAGVLGADRRLLAVLWWRMRIVLLRAPVAHPLGAVHRRMTLSAAAAVTDAQEEE